MFYETLWGNAEDNDVVPIIVNAPFGGNQIGRALHISLFSLYMRFLIHKGCYLD